jgi:hypothetical protein
LTVTEARASLIERLLIAALWGLKRFERYTCFFSDVIVLLPHQSEVITVKKSDPPLRIQGAIVELSSYRCKFASGEGAWQL